MKYFLLVLLILAGSVFGQNINPVYEINRYTVPGQESVTEAKTSTLHTKAEAAAIACKCKVPFRTQGYYDGSFLKSSSSSRSSSSVASSAASSAAPVSSSGSASSFSRVTLSWTCPSLNEDETVLYEWQIYGYSLLINGKETVLEPTLCRMSHIVDLPAGAKPQIATIKRNYNHPGIYSKYVGFSQ